MQKIVTSLWFDDEAEEAAKFYCSIFPNSKITKLSRYGSAGPRPEGMVMTVSFELDGNKFVALNGGPDFKFNEAISVVVECEDQTEVDRLWAALTKDGGEPGPCGWLKDRFGLSWQIAPRELQEMFDSPDKEGGRRAMEAMLKMSKLDIEGLKKAYEGRSP